VIVGDHGNKPDTGVLIARDWFDNRHVDVVADVGTSSVGLAIVALVNQRDKIFLNPGAADDFTGAACSPLVTQWNFNAYSTTNAMVQAVMASAGHDTWFIIAQNYAFGKAQVADLHKEVEAKGGKVVGEILHPIGLQDYSSFLLQAQASGANVIAIGDVGGDQANVLKQAKEFGLDKGSAQVVAVGSSNLPDMEALGVEAAGGVLFVSTFEWSRTPGARAWTQRFVDKMGRFPSQNQVAVYSLVRHYLQGVKDTGTDDSTTVMTRMRETPVHDIFAESGRLREDGEMVHDIYIIKAKRPDEVKVKGDLFDIVRTIPGNEAYQSLADSACPLLKK
jgi:branched-chain amino acid transport system substrate-binding protein